MFYTRQGDQGNTCTLRSRNRISKNAPEIEALGALDEINSFIGLCTAKLRAEPNTHCNALATTLYEVQHILFIIQAELAGAPGKTVHLEHVLWLENMNRLSSFLYICARSVNQEKNVVEQVPRQPILDNF